VRVRLVTAADRPSQNVKQGELFTREFEWQFSPHNLMYERNRL
jgi:hypothetical protein